MHTQNQTFDIVALGELLIDFTTCGISEQGNRLLEANPGGAPGNFLAMLARLGFRTAMIAKVGHDQFGRDLRRTLEECGIDTRHILLDPGHNTTLAFVHNDEHGDRDFSFYRNPGADMMLTADEIDPGIFRHTKAFHFGTISMTHPGVRAATLRALHLAQENECLISFDPNIRPPLWNSMEEAAEQLHTGLSACHIAKLSAEELQLATGIDNTGEAALAILRQYPGIRFLSATMGKQGSTAYCGGHRIHADTYTSVPAIDTTGAGDTYGACILGQILCHGIGNLTPETVTGILLFANAAATIVTTRRGALRVMPSPQEIASFMETHPAPATSSGLY